MTVRAEIAAILDQSPLAKWGFADVSEHHELGRAYPTAISLAVAYKKPVPYDAEMYRAILLEGQGVIDTAMETLISYFKKHAIGYRVIPQGGQDPATLRAEFSHKLPAMLAGLGWIGKNSLLVTAEFGPRVRLATILFAMDIGIHNTIAVSKCGTCAICVKACPYGYIKGVEWQPGIQREQLVSLFDCNRKREEFIPATGHKDECGHCLLECPVGS